MKTKLKNVIPGVVFTLDGYMYYKNPGCSGALLTEVEYNDDGKLVIEQEMMDKLGPAKIGTQEEMDRDECDFTFDVPVETQDKAGIVFIVIPNITGVQTPKIIGPFANERIAKEVFKEHKLKGWILSPVSSVENL